MVSLNHHPKEDSPSSSKLQLPKKPVDALCVGLGDFLPDVVGRYARVVLLPSVLAALGWIPRAPDVSSDKIQIRAEMDTLPALPSIFSCNQLGMVEEGQLYQAKLSPGTLSATSAPGHRPSWLVLPWCLVSAGPNASALGLVGFLQVDYRVLFCFCSHPILLLCTLMSPHVSPDSPEVSLDAFCFRKFSFLPFFSVVVSECDSG